MKTAHSILLVLLLTASSALTDTVPDQKVSTQYPYLCSGALRDAVITDLKEDVVASFEGSSISTKDLSEAVSKHPKHLQEKYSKYPSYVLEQRVTQMLLAREAREWAKQSNKKTSASEAALVQSYLSSKVPEITVTDKDIEEFYNRNSKMFGDAPMNDLKESIKGLVAEEKRADVIDRFSCAAGTRHKIQVSSSWIRTQAEKWSKSLIESARLSGKPTFVNFSVIGCCDKTEPIVKEVRAASSDKLNVIFVNVKEEDILSQIYGVRSIPVQIFFNKEGKEILRHQGLMTKDEILAVFK